MRKAKDTKFSPLDVANLPDGLEIREVNHTLVSEKRDENDNITRPAKIATVKVLRVKEDKTAAAGVKNFVKLQGERAENEKAGVIFTARSINSMLSKAEIALLKIYDKDEKKGVSPEKIADVVLSASKPREADPTEKIGKNVAAKLVEKGGKLSRADLLAMGIVLED